jgi:hypothetical protein
MDALGPGDNHPSALGAHSLTPSMPIVLWPNRSQNRLHDSLRRAQGTERYGAHKAHPHPSGAADPSQADELITRRLKEALALVDVRLLDHIIVAGGDAVSFADRGLL